MKQKLQQSRVIGAGQQQVRQKLWISIFPTKYKNYLYSLVLIISSPATFSIEKSNEVPATGQIENNQEQDLQNSKLKLQDLKLQIAGNMCLQNVGEHNVQLVHGSNIRIKIPVASKIDNLTDSGIITRGSCTFALPLKAKDGHKIIVLNVKLAAQLKLNGHGLTREVVTRANTQVELFQAGSKGEILKLEVEGVSQNQNVRKILAIEDVVTETSCGGSMILRGNIATTIIGKTATKAYNSDLYMDLIQIPCE